MFSIKTVQDLVTMAQRGEITSADWEQRYKHARLARKLVALTENVLRGLPVGMIAVNEDHKTLFSNVISGHLIVDAIRYYIEDKFCAEYQGEFMKYSELPLPIQRRFRSSSVPVWIGKDLTEETEDGIFIAMNLSATTN